VAEVREWNIKAAMPGWLSRSWGGTSEHFLQKTITPHLLNCGVRILEFKVAVGDFEEVMAVAVENRQWTAVDRSNRFALQAALEQALKSAKMRPLPAA
jgi:hypothetical protein